MEVKKRLALKHIDNGKYLSWSIDNFPLTHKLTQARRFIDTEQLRVFLETSPYKPDDPGEFEIVTIKISYEEEISNADTEG